MHVFVEQLIQTFFLRKSVWLIPILAVVLLLVGAVMVADPALGVLFFAHSSSAG